MRFAQKGSSSPPIDEETSLGTRHGPYRSNAGFAPMVNVLEVCVITPINGRK